MSEIKISLAAARKNANLNQNDVAEILGKNKATIRNWESGKTIPDFLMVNKLSEIYKIPIENLKIAENE